MIPDDCVIIPEPYKILAWELKRLSGVIVTALINKPVPSGSPWELPDSLRIFMDSASCIIPRLTACFNKMPDCSAEDEQVDSKNAAMLHWIGNLEGEVKEAIRHYHKVWSRPFPQLYADGQPVMSAVFEDILKECLILFEKLIDIFELPPEEIPQKYGSTKINLSITFGPEAIERLSLWFQHNRSAFGCFSMRKSGLSDPLLLGLLLGWGIGHHYHD